MLSEPLQRKLQASLKDKLSTEGFITKGHLRGTQWTTHLQHHVIRQQIALVDNALGLQVKETCTR